MPVDGGIVSVATGGSGPPAALFHRYAGTSLMGKPLAVALAPRCTVVAPDLAGIGDPSMPTSDIDMKTAVQRIHAFL